LVRFDSVQTGQDAPGRTVVPETQPPPRDLRVVIADDDPAFAQLLAVLVNDVEGYEVVGIAADGEEAVQVTIWQDADVVLMDIDMPKIDGLRATELLRKSRPRACVLFVSGLDDERTTRARGSDAAGFIPKVRAAEQLESVLRALRRGSSAEGSG
jgi:DNA-binding NarL/FixJ family response regulator